ncbi:hypothetical protein N3K66_003362 [Trichothecium roseum]|uniref:Uncharacterized protein n=1 Tax=Trichothecium roseum TaxID=47278 RepID=A0ACC0V570_9HYPO|nr:hypothetical protein N3K66_003362 [Trichothecium roseum]
MKKAFGSLSQGTCYLPVFGSDTCFCTTHFSPRIRHVKELFANQCVFRRSLCIETDRSLSTDDNVLVTLVDPVVPNVSISIDSRCR